MGSPSRPPSYKAYGVTPYCQGCGRRLRADEPAWFSGAGYHTPAAVFGWECIDAAVKWHDGVVA